MEAAAISEDEEDEEEEADDSEEERKQNYREDKDRWDEARRKYGDCVGLKPPPWLGFRFGQRGSQRRG